MAETRLDFWYSFGQMYIMARISGILPFSIKRNKYGEIFGPRIVFLDRLWWIMSIFNSMALFVTCFIILKPLDMTANLAIDAGNLTFISGFAFSAFFIVIDMFNRNRFIDIFRTFETFDRKV